MKQRGSLLAAFSSKDDDEESGKEEPSCMTEFFAEMRRLCCLATARQAEPTHMFIAVIAVDKAIYVRSVSLTNHPEGSEHREYESRTVDVAAKKRESFSVINFY